MVIEFQNLSKQYGNKYALKDFTATLNSGVYGLLGANGAGKTTLINILVGVLKPDGGRILIDGRDVRNIGTDFLSYIGYLPQYPEFYRDFTVMDFLMYMCALKGIPSKEGRIRAENLLETVNLSDAKQKKIGALSGGMRQRVGVVQAMLNNPMILIFDEPTAGLDPQERIRFRNLIARFSKDRLVLLATHIVSDVEFIANQVLILKEGQLIAQNTPIALENQISGTVWEVTLSDSDGQEQFSQYKISNMQRNRDNVILRLLSDQQPHPSAVQVRPNLEDVFLSYFGEGDV
jgi:ABC-2 type transport system ATP-binding protein